MPPNEFKISDEGIEELDKYIADEKRHQGVLNALRALKNPALDELIKNNNKAFAIFLAKLKEISASTVSVDLTPLNSLNALAQNILDELREQNRLLAMKPERVYFKRDGAQYLDYMEIKYQNVASLKSA